jgi:hypothetical protein
VTLILDEIDPGNMRRGLSGAKIENGYRMLTFNAVLESSVAGLSPKFPDPRGCGCGNPSAGGILSRQFIDQAG